MIVTDISNGITGALYDYTGAPTYADLPRQNMIFPCFRVLLINPTQYNELGPMRRRSYDFDIQYYLDETGDIEDEDKLRELADDLYSVLEFIKLENGQLVRGWDMNYRITDGILHFYVTYIVFVTKPHEDVPKMKTLKQNWRTTNGRDEAISPDLGDGRNI